MKYFKEAPYVIVDSITNNITKYKGFCIDLLEKISKICEFNYTIKLVDDGLHGSFVDGKWNGLVSELIDKKADLVVAGNILIIYNFMLDHDDMLYKIISTNNLKYT